MKKVFRVGVSESVNNWLAAGNFTVSTKKEGLVEVETLSLVDCHGISCAYYSNSTRIGDGADLFIMPWQSQELQDHEEFVIRRLSKPQQHVVLNRLAKKHFERYSDNNAQYFLPIPTYTSRNGNGATQYNHPHCFGFTRDILFQGQYSFTKRIVIKPTDGARSMGQVVFNSSIHTLSEVMAIIDPSLIARGGRPGAGALTSDPIDPEAKLKAVIDLDSAKKYNIFAEHNLPEGICVFLGDADPEEALRVFNNGCFMQPEVNSVKAEYRLLVGADGIYAASSRPRGNDATGTDYKAVTKEKDKLIFLNEKPCDKTVFGHVMGVCPVTTIVFNDMHAFITDNLDKFAYNSIDVFVTDNGQWGIFEYCNQFSIADYGVTSDGECNVGSLMRNWLTKLVTEQIDN